MKKNSAMIQIDCDREWDDLGVSIKILLEFKKIFENNNIKATWFVVGNDIEIQPVREVFTSLINDGNEIGNHTYSHHKNFILLNDQEKKMEIEKCDNLIQQLGYTPVGFRTPHFGLDNSIYKILKEMKYQYDSSICPSPFLNSITKVKNILNMGIEGKRFFLKNRRANKVNFKKINDADTTLKEIPISVFPYLRFPIHASYAMTLPYKLSYHLSNMLINYYSRSIKPLVYVFHLNDLCPDQYFKSKEFKYFMPLEKRKDFIKYICSNISRTFSITLTREYIHDDYN